MVSAVEKPVRDSPSALTEFHCFSELPTELRLNIWKLTISPRLIELIADQNNLSIFHKFIHNLPELLHVNKESRAEGLRYYQLSRQATKAHHRRALNRFYFNPSIDALLISPHVSLVQLIGITQQNECGLFGQIKYVAYCFPTAFLRVVCEAFTSLREFICYILEATEQAKKLKCFITSDNCTFEYLGGLQIYAPMQQPGASHQRALAPLDNVVAMDDPLRNWNEKSIIDCRTKWVHAGETCSVFKSAILCGERLSLSGREIELFRLTNTIKPARK